MVHLDHVQNYDGSLAELAQELGDLKYDSLAEFLQLLSAKIAQDGAKDSARGRGKLAAHLHRCAEKLHEAANECHHAWTICEPFMKPSGNDSPKNGH